MLVRLNDIRQYMISNKIDNNLDLDKPISPLGIYKIKKNNDKQWIIYIQGPDSTIYRNGYFKISIDFSDQFPKQKPKCFFLNKILHLNVMTNGRPIVYFLDKWDKSTTISELLVGLYLFFIFEQNYNDPLDPRLAILYKQNHNEFVSKVKECVKQKASPTSEDLNLFKENNEKKIKELKDKLNKANKIIEKQQKEIQDLVNHINSFKNRDNEINTLKNGIKRKNEEINQLIQKNNNINKNNIIENINDIPKKQIDLEEMRCVTFITTDQSLFYGISCSGKDIFAEIEEKLYKEYPKYRETNNIFLSNGNLILRFKTINDNKIGSGKPVILVKPS